MLILRISPFFADHLFALHDSVQRSKSLLPVNDEGSRTQTWPIRTQRTSIFVIRGMPKDERSDRKAHEERVEQVAYLSILPYEWPLQIR